MAAHVGGPVGAAPPPTPNEVKLLAEVRRLQAELAECRSVIALHQQNGCGVQLYAEGLRAEVARAEEQRDAAERRYADLCRHVTAFFTDKAGSSWGEYEAAVARLRKALGGER